MIAGTRALVREILENPHGRPWVLRGYGQLLRLYPGGDEKVCLHVWYPRPDRIVEMHTHPFSLRSLVVAGTVEQFRYEAADAGAEYRRLRIPDAPRDAETVRLAEGPLEVYRPGDAYEQAATEIHRTMPLLGTVTLLEWGGGDPVEQHLFWPPGGEAAKPWLPREAREASAADIDRFVAAALERWDA